MAKPIFIIKLPQSEKKDIVDSLKKSYPKLYLEYHVFVIFGTNIESVEFEAFNPKDIPDIDIDKLKEILENG